MVLFDKDRLCLLSHVEFSFVGFSMGPGMRMSGRVQAHFMCCVDSFQVKAGDVRF